MASHVPHITTPVERIGVGEAARITGLHPDTIRRAADANKIRSIRTPGGHRQLDLSDVLALAAGTLTSPQDAESQSSPHVAEPDAESPASSARIVQERSDTTLTGVGAIAGAARAHTAAPATSRTGTR